MPPLSRNGARPLLTKVNNRPHATQDDHDNALPTPPASNSTRSSGSGVQNEEMSEIEVYADPISDEELLSPTIPEPAPTESAKEKISSFQHTKHNIRKNDRQSPRFKMPSESTPPSTGSKRSAEPDSDGSGSDGYIFGSQDNPKRQKSTRNIHAHIRPPKTTYSKRKSANTMGFRETRKPELQDSAPRAVFKTAKGVEIFPSKGDHDRHTSFKTAKVPEHSDPGLSSGSSPLSSLPSDDLDDDVVEISPPSPQGCPICGETVGEEVREDFEDDYRKGPQLNFRWQQRFCLYHRQHDARKVWRERGYPEIDWDNFDDRLQRSKHRNYLHRIINGDVISVYRQRMERGMRARNNKTMEALDDCKSRTNAGYYGPRGEKMMTDFILAEFADALRDLAKTDRLLTISGIQGGIPGFVQTVLVPELTASLVRQDMNAHDDRDPMDVIAASTELGDLLNPILNDRVHVVEVLEND